MQTAKCDSKGRLYLRESVRSLYGERFVIIEAPGELVLLPVPRNPLKDLGELGQRLRGSTVRELREKIYDRAKKEVVS